MREVNCPYCTSRASKYGKTKAGSQRWRCSCCGNTFTEKIDATAKNLKIFFNWLFGKGVQTDILGNGRTFRRKVAKFWTLWPLPPKMEKTYDVLYLDGIYLSRKLCVLISSSDEVVLGWYVCRYEHSKAWMALMKRIAAPRVVISDGGSGFAKALRTVWPHTSHQRCLFHLFAQVRRYTTRFPKTLAGQELYSLAKDLFTIKDMDAAYAWIDGLLAWRQRHDNFLQEMTVDEMGNKHSTHERLLKAEASLWRLVRNNTVFTYLEFVDITFHLTITA